MYDVIIVGGGPAGLTAAIYCARANLKTLVLEKDTIGGQIASSPLVENYPGFKSISGGELANNLYEQAEALKVDIELEEVIEIKQGKIKKIITDAGEYETKVVIIATGSSYRLLGIPNEKELIGHGISFCTSCDGAFYKDKVVAVVGGANTAVTNAIYLSNLCKKVYLICREEALQCEKKLYEKVVSKENVIISYNSIVTEIIGMSELEKIRVKEETKEYELKIDGMFIAIGMDAQTDVVISMLQLDSEKYIINDECKTSEAGIFVAGDCRKKRLRQLTTATNDGSIAATYAIEYLESHF